MSDADYLEASANPHPRITWAGVVTGFRVGWPLFASGFIYGIAFGSLAATMGLSLLEAVAMSVLVFSGTAQIAVVQIWPTQPGLLPAALIVLVANVRYALMSASLRPWLGGVSPWRVYPMLAFMVDSAYALGLKSRADGNGDGGVILGSGLASFTGWIIATGVGFATGQLIANPRAIGLDFVVVAFCVAAATAMTRSTRSMRALVPAVVAAVVIVVMERLAPGPWTLVAAALAAAITGAALYDRERDPA